MTVSFDTLPAFPAAALARLRQQPLHARDPFGRHFERGAALHAAGLPDHALVEFEQALALRPDDVQAASACATVLLEQRRPQAARRILLAHAAGLSATAEGCCNLALAHSLGEETDAAARAFRRALELVPGYPRAIEGLVRQAGLARDWEVALAHAATGAQAHPELAPMWLLWIDTLLHARRPHDALAVLDQQIAHARHMPRALPDFGVRRALVQALMGQWDAARATLVGLPPGTGPEALARLQGGLLPSLGVGRRTAAGVDVVLWCAQYAAAGVVDGDWRSAGVLAQLLHGATRPGAAPTAPALFQAARPVLDSLPLPDDVLSACLARADAADLAARPANDPRAPPLPRADARLRISLLVPPLDAERVRWLARQLGAHDRTRFELRAFAALPPAEDGSAEAEAQAELAARLDHLQRIDHLSDDELVARIRLDQPDLLIDLSAGHTHGRPGVVARRLATVHARMHAVPAHVADAPFDYLITDTYTHPAPPPPHGGAWARLPGSAWLAPGAQPACETPSPVREDVPLRFTARVAAPCVDEHSFSLWLQLLLQAPGTELELLPLAFDAQARLTAEARRRGVDPARLRFETPESAPAARRIHLDPLLRSDPVALTAALAAGDVVLACAGARTASRPGAAVLADAGLAQWVAATPAELQALALRLAADASAWDEARQALVRTRDQARADPASPTWWNTQARAAELGWAWTRMVERARTGLPPLAFDVPRGAVPQALNL